MPLEEGSLTLTHPCFISAFFQFPYVRVSFPFTLEKHFLHTMGWVTISSSNLASPQKELLFLRVHMSIRKSEVWTLLPSSLSGLSLMQSSTKSHVGTEFCHSHRCAKFCEPLSPLALSSLGVVAASVCC